MQEIIAGHAFHHLQFFFFAARRELSKQPVSKSESIKSEIGFHEKMFFAAIAILVTLVGWMATNYITVSALTLSLALLCSIGAGVFVIYQYRLIKRLIGELRDA